MSDALPRYAAIAVDLREGIENGTYPPGALLPSQTELCRTYRAHVSTVRQAIRLLTQQGLVQAYPRRGFVVTPERRRRYVPVRMYASIPPDAPTHPDTLRVAWVTVNEHPAGEDIASALDLDPDTPILVRTRAYLGASAQPAQMTTSHLPADLARATPLASPEPLDADDPPHWPRALAETTGHPVDVITTRTEARAPTDTEAETLHSTTPVLVHAATAYRRSRQPFDHTVTVWPAGAISLTDAYRPD